MYKRVIYTVTRRNFLQTALAIPLATATALPACATATNYTIPILQPAKMWQILDSVQQVLFPSEPNIPGATEINAINYLRWVMSDPKTPSTVKDFIVQGTNWLEDMAIRTKQQTFTALTLDDQEIILHQISQSTAGEAWLATLLTYIIEALLTDPIYGGNPNGIGWQWLQHTPGYPRPHDNLAYRTLGY